MPEYLHPAHIANVVTSFAFLWSGIAVCLFWFIERTQPIRWLFFYITIIITAVPTIAHHIIPQDMSWTSLDIMSNILLVFSLQIALAGDYLSPKSHRLFLIILTIFNLLVFGYLLSLLFLPVPNFYLSLGNNKGFTLGEIALILNAILAVIILGLNFGKLDVREKVILLLIIAIFSMGLYFATGSDDYIYPKYIGWHSMWHLTASFGFVFFWYFNHLRFSVKENKYDSA